MWRFSLLTYLTCGLVLTATLVADTAHAREPNLVPLYHWYSPDREDNFTTSDRRWSGARGDTRSPDYKLISIAGYVHSPDLVAAPPETEPLYSWYSPSRGDNFLTSDPNWRPRNSDDNTRLPDYRLVRLEGYVYTRPLAGTLPLQNHWSPVREDNFATTNPLWIGEVGKESSPDYTLYRGEGYVVSPGDRNDSYKQVTPQSLIDRLGIGQARIGPPGGGRIGKVAGNRPLLAILVETPYLRFNKTEGQIRNLLFGGTGGVNLAAYFDEMSGGEFTWTEADVIGPLMVNANIIEASSGTVVESRRAKLRKDAIKAASNNGFDFSSFDRDGDNIITPYELGVVIFLPDPSPAGSFSGEAQTKSGTVKVPGGPRVDWKAPAITEAISLETLAHEMVHALASGVDHDIYGSRSFYSSLMSGWANADSNLRHLDPWHKMRLGWGQPRIEVISPYIPGSSQRLNGPAIRPSGSIIFHDVSRPTFRNWRDYELFLMEFRASSYPANDYDISVVDDGIVLWYARMGQPYIPGENDTKYLLPPGLPELVMEQQDCTSVPPSRIWDPGNKIGQGLWVVSSPIQCRGFDTYWNSSHGETQVRWYPTNAYPRAAGRLKAPRGEEVPIGDLSGLRFRVGAISASSANVEWRFNSDPLIPRIDGTTPNTSYEPGQNIQLLGNFGIQGNKVVSMQTGLNQIAMSVQTFTPRKIWAKIPSFAPAGTYDVRIYLDPTHTVSSNAVEMVVVSP